METIDIVSTIVVAGIVMFVASAIYLFANCVTYIGPWSGGCIQTRGFPFIDIMGVVFYVGLASWILGIVVSIAIPCTKPLPPPDR